MKYINKFQTVAAYDEAEKYYPNVSYIEATDEVRYQETDPTITVAIYTTTSANQNVKILNNQERFDSIVIDGEAQTIGTDILNHTFATTGNHKVELVCKYVTLPDNCFDGCTELTDITLSTLITGMNGNVFHGCTGLTSVKIGYSVTYIYGAVYYDSPNITSITVDRGNTVYNDGNGSNCIIKTSTNELIQGCKNTVIPNTVTKIDNIAFRIMGLTGALNIPASVTSIGDSAFMNNMGITSITCNATTPPTLGSNVFYNIPATCPIYVPAASVDAYKAASGWSDRAAYIQAIP